jgi:hypothetical protein
MVQVVQDGLVCGNGSTFYMEVEGIASLLHVFLETSFTVVLGSSKLHLV